MNDPMTYDADKRVILDQNGLAVARDVGAADAIRITAALSICADLPPVLTDTLNTHVYDADQGEEWDADSPLVVLINRAENATADEPEGVAPAPAGGPSLFALLDEALAYEAEAFDDDGDVNGGDMVEFFGAWRRDLREALAARPRAFTPPPVGAEEIINDLVGAVAGLDHEVGQMKGMFGDEDGTTQQAIDDGDEATERARLYLKNCGAPVPAGLMAAVATLYGSWDADDEEDAAAVEALPRAMNEALADVLGYATGNAGAGVTLYVSRTENNVDIWSPMPIAGLEIVTLNYDIDDLENYETDDVTMVRMDEGAEYEPCLVSHNVITGSGRVPQTRPATDADMEA